MGHPLVPPGEGAYSMHLSRQRVHYFKWGHTTDQLREGVSPGDKRSTMWTTMVGHKNIHNVR